MRVYDDLIAINNFQQAEDGPRYEKLKSKAMKEMNIRCGYCLDLIGGEAAKLDALSCTHFFHTRCLEGGCIAVCRCCQQNIADDLR